MTLSPSLGEGQCAPPHALRRPAARRKRHAPDGELIEHGLHPRLDLRVAGGEHVLVFGLRGRMSGKRSGSPNHTVVWAGSGRYGT